LVVGDDQGRSETKHVRGGHVDQDALFQTRLEQALGLAIDLDAQRLQWVRAGHDPAIFYDPNTDTFEDLMGSGLALGLDEDWQYSENEKTGLTRGQIILLGTDGIWEAHNRNGEMFGKTPIYEIIRQNTAGSAKEILDLVIQSLMRFQEDLRPEDDVTLVVIKIDQIVR